MKKTKKVNAIAIRNGNEYLFNGDIVKPLFVRNDVLLMGEHAKILQLFVVLEIAKNGDKIYTYQANLEIVDKIYTYQANLEIVKTLQLPSPAIGLKMLTVDVHSLTNAGEKRKFHGFEHIG